MNKLRVASKKSKARRDPQRAALKRPLVKCALVAILVGATIGLTVYINDPESSNPKSSAAKPTQTVNSTKPSNLIPEDPLIPPQNGVIWAGYVAPRQGLSTYTSVRGSFTVQAITCDSVEQNAMSETYAQWVGLDGWYDKTVEQIGITAHCVDASYTNGRANNNASSKPGKLKPYYYAWWMNYGGGDYSTILDEIPVHPGDRMNASVEYTGGDTFKMRLVNETTGIVYKKSTTCRIENVGGPCPRVFAEWIVERAGNSALSDFGVARFDEASATTDEAGTGPQTPAELQAFPVDMIQGTNTLTHTSGLSESGDAFKVTYLQHGQIGQ